MFQETKTETFQEQLSRLSETNIQAYAAAGGSFESRQLYKARGISPVTQEHFLFLFIANAPGSGPGVKLFRAWICSEAEAIDSYKRI